MRVAMYPQNMAGEESGIARVVQAYQRYLPQYGIEFVQDGEPCDLKAVHAGSMDCEPNEIIVAHLHGLYWTADYPAPKFEYRTNQKVINSMIHAKEMIVPSAWVNEAIQRDMRRSAHVVPHGIEWQEWEPEESEGYVLWNKNRPQDVCTPRAVSWLADRLPKQNFVTTFTVEQKPNVNVVGVLPHVRMKTLVQRCGVYLVTSKETFCIGALEAMAAGKPVLYYNYGNVPILVPHGVAGYGAQPGNEEDLLVGLEYCLTHQKMLGENGRELVKQYSWDKACEQIAGIYRKALEPEEKTVSIIIPCYNKAGMVSRAIDSALVQTHYSEIIVVDDGSTDGSWGEIQKYGDYVKSIRTENKGVAAARNTGIARAKGKYVVCLDADDAIEPIFVERMVQAISGDRSLGVVYSRIRSVHPDGRTDISTWPAEWNYDEHLNGQNQVPTCCLMRRDMVLALGGYKECYAQGKKCGFEDSDLFLRMGAYGWRGKLVTDEPLFIYSVGTGQITSSSKQEIAKLQRDEQEYYRTHYPWYTGEQLFASAATPKVMSHPVRQYDEPLISVVIFGTDQLNKTLDSLESQTEHRWEAIADSTPVGYPYVRQGQPRGLFTVHLSSGDILSPTFLEQALRVYSTTDNSVVVRDGSACAVLCPTDWVPNLTTHIFCQLITPLYARNMSNSMLRYRGKMGCPGCHRQVSVTGKASGKVMKTQATELNDNDYQWVQWDGPPKTVVGPRTQTIYGLKNTGERFLCHVSDAQALGVKGDEVKRPVVPIKPTPPPKRIKE